ncbi:MAG: DNA-binding protein [Clostridia bacterium]|nr:DNA-binding protein [Clostridia bacterium]MBR1685251.1 DNA-binding protein [Clostridia bacterium]MBR2287064.1 DNA-binding protein [Clostridia bacterium]
MFYEKMGDTYAVRLKRGEEIMESLKRLCEREAIETAEVSGIGAADLAEVGLYSVSERAYHKTRIEEEMEITSILGNVTRKDGEVYLHLHINLGLPDTTVRGGHLNLCRISGTCEMFVRVLPGKIGRELDEETGLNVFAFSDGEDK